MKKMGIVLDPPIPEETWIFQIHICKPASQITKYTPKMNQQE